MKKFTAAIQKKDIKILKKLKGVERRGRNASEKKVAIIKTRPNKSMNGSFKAGLIKMGAKMPKVLKKKHWWPARRYNVIFKRATPRATVKSNADILATLNVEDDRATQVFILMLYAYDPPNIHWFSKSSSNSDKEKTSKF